MMGVHYQSLESKNALVTGGSRGIGRATCEMLAATGVSVIVHYHRNDAAAGEVVKGIRAKGGTAEAIQADLGKVSAVRALAQKSLKALGHIDILVNNAGDMTHAPVADMDEEMWDHAQNLHLKSVFLLTRELIPSMIGRSWGRIINVSSQVVYTGSNRHAHYAAAKAGLLGFTFSIVKELGSFGITANLVSPGRVLTDMIIPQVPDREEEWLRQTPLGRFGNPDEVANTIVFLASGEAGYISGANIHVNGGLVMG